MITPERYSQIKKDIQSLEDDQKEWINKYEANKRIVESLNIPDDEIERFSEPKDIAPLYKGKKDIEDKIKEFEDHNERCMEVRAFLDAKKSVDKIQVHKDECDRQIEALTKEMKEFEEHAGKSSGS